MQHPEGRALQQEEMQYENTEMKILVCLKNRQKLEYQSGQCQSEGGDKGIKRVWRGSKD